MRYPSVLVCSEKPRFCDPWRRFQAALIDPRVVGIMPTHARLISHTITGRLPNRLLGFLIERRTGLLYVLQILCCPDPNATKRRTKAKAQRSQFVLDLRWPNGMDRADDKAV